MKITDAACKHQQQRVSRHKGEISSHHFFKILTNDTLLDKMKSLLPEHRERRYPPAETLSMFLAQAMNDDRSCQNIVNQFAIQRLNAGLSEGTTYTGGILSSQTAITTFISH